MSHSIEYDDNSPRKGGYKYQMKKIWDVLILVALELEVLVRTQSMNAYL